ncbi:MAG: tetratricopeptide repeat protein [Candidatus Marinimicrobia bacterium]|jgi:tetratricopeptide (TPR) repeat protein|nr:tetratricopeptide repeat protein [Candidatus Neomarinimicrobiota bacterium]MBT3675564.1 tetratricopeptide repeat protein [Candidatus Neomarinimicrobiota bacterium]MBT3763359.1 tetratricopeptide repeat protein [Candidatus Neomarinimicrobiota bacterium]MBT4069073.1 tetratricopeptide repeat protein [Candidatus Neomarinimicrobiota bacterium]MBT4270229.1 tetratricopeptide repeat protein [Candidatus Neomarinimicrobiota bacterium]
MRSIYIWTTRFILAIALVGILPVPNNSSIVLAQSKKAKASQASKYAKRGNSKAKKKDYRGALSDYKKAYKLSPSKNYNKKVQQLTSLAKKQGGKKSSKKKPSSKKVAQATAYAKRGNSKAKNKDYAAALKDYQKAYKLNPSSSNKKKVQQLQSILKKRGNQVASRNATKAKVPRLSDIPTISPVKYANDIYNIAEAFELSSRNLARATHYLDDKEKRKITRIEARRAPTITELENAARKEPNDFRLQVDLARNYEGIGQFETAKEIYLKLAAQNPFNADSHFHLGSFYSRFGQMTKARHSFDEAMEVQPNHRATIEAMASIFGTNEKQNLSNEVLAKSAEKDPNGPGQRMQTIRRNLEDRNFEYAAKLAQGGQDLFPRQSGFIFLKGRAFEGLGDQGKAKASYQEAIKKDPTYQESYVALGDLYYGQGKYVYAALTYGDAVRLDPVDSETRFKQGHSYFKGSEWGRAAFAWEDLLHYDPHNKKVRTLLPQAYYILAVEYNRVGESGLGQTSFRKALSVNKNSGVWLPGSMQVLGGFYREKGMFRESLAAYQESIELKPSDSGTYLGLGITYWKMNESALAKAAWGRSMELDPANNDARGWLLLAGKMSG